MVAHLYQGSLKATRDLELQFKFYSISKKFNNVGMIGNRRFKIAIREKNKNKINRQIIQYVPTRRSVKSRRIV